MAKNKLLDDIYHYKIIFQQLAENEFIDTEISNFDFLSFSSQKQLFDYQTEALKNALRVLLVFFNDFQADKEKFYRFCQNKYPHENLDFNKLSPKAIQLLQEYFPIIRKKIEFSHFVNRMGFWMTMGSGKTILIIKLIELLGQAMKLHLIPKKNIFFFTANEGLLNRFKQELKEYNLTKEKKILASSLKDYEAVSKYGNILEYEDIRIFCYRADLLGEEKKETILDFKDYLNNGDNYIILDEAHKGDKQDSIRQNIFSILSQNGFLFNFSATFTAPSDVATTIYNLNQAVWIQKGYGKKLFLLDNDLKAFREKSDLNEAEKQKATLKSLLLLTLAKKNRIANSYHNPMMVVFTNSVNVSESDAELFFKTLQSIARDDIKELFDQSRKELKDEFKTTKYLITDNKSGEGVAELSDQIGKISFDELKTEVFYAKSGNIEAIINPKDHQEIAFKLDTASQAFCLIKIGDISAWLKEKLIDIKIDETYKEEKYFDTLDEGSINILIGSRSFYEGWDSTRPNIMLFLNIGVNNDTKKFVTQSLGRGMRIESIKGNRQRMEYLEAQDKAKIAQNPQTLETLFVVSTNKNAISSIIKWQEEQNMQSDWIEISLRKNQELTKEKNLFIPTYESQKIEATKIGHKKGFRLSEKNKQDLKIYVEHLGKTLFALKHKIFNKEECDILFELISKNTFFVDNNIHYKSLDILIEKLKAKIYLKQSQVKGFKTLSNEIIHFKKIKVREDKNKEFIQKVNEAVALKQLSNQDILKKLEKGEINFQDALQLQQSSIEFDEAKLKKILNHCYLPIVYGENLDWIKHIITEKSEIEFLENLEKIYTKLDKKYQWWAFSRISPHYDRDIYIPYTQDSEEKHFYPDFIFWLQEKDKQTILFVDPKGTAYTDYQAKADGYEKLFIENEMTRIFYQDSMQIQVKLFFVNIQNSDIGGKYENFWCNKSNLEKMFDLEG